MREDRPFKVLFYSLLLIDSSVVTRGPCTDDYDLRARSIVSKVAQFGGVEIDVDGRVVEIDPWDLPSMEDYDRLRPLAYQDAHVVMIFFAIDSPESLENVQTLVTDVIGGVLMM